MVLKELFLTVIIFTFFSGCALASSETVTGPVTFLWPEQRTWYAAWQTNSPCGTNDGLVENRTNFPLDSGKVALVVAGDTFDVTIRIAYKDEPTLQSDFTTEIIHTVSELEAGHQCYYTPDSPSSVLAGTNATIQLEYISTYKGSENETFYACADIKFVEDIDFTTSVSCFNVSITDPSTDPIATSSSSSTPTSSTTSSTSPQYTSGTPSVASESYSNGLSKAARAGIAVGCIVGGLAIISISVLMHKYKYRPTFRNRKEVERESWRMRRMDDKNMNVQ